MKPLVRRHVRVLEPHRKLPAGFRASPSWRAEVPRPCCPQSLSISIERLTVECRRPWGIHRIRLEEPELSRRNPLPFWEGESPNCLPRPSTSATIQATAGLMRNALHPVVSSFPPLLPRWTLSRVHVPARMTQTRTRSSLLRRITPRLRILSTPRSRTARV